MEKFFGLITWTRGVEVQLKGDGVLCVIMIQSFSFKVEKCLRFNDNMDERCGSSIDGVLCVTLFGFSFQGLATKQSSKSSYDTSSQ